MKMGYVPDGFTEAQYKAKKSKEANERATRKSFWAKKSPDVQTLTDWQAKRDAKFKNQPGAGHTFVKIRGSDPAPKAPQAAAKAQPASKFGGLFKR